MKLSGKPGLYKKMIINAIAPVIVLGLAIAIVCYARFIDTLYSDDVEYMREVSHMVAQSYDDRWPGNYNIAYNSDGTFDLKKGDSVITPDCSIVDRYAAGIGCEISVIYMDMRVHTTFKTDSGKRLAGVCTNKETTDIVLLGNSVHYEDVDILGEKYLVSYEPLINGDGSIAGMVEIAKKSAEMKRNVLLAVWPVFLLSLGGIVLAIVIAYRNTKEITGVLSKLNRFLGSVSAGDLMSELDSDVTRRADELGSIAKASVSMQHSIRSFVETDPLTKLGNRRYVNAMLEKIKARSFETGQPYSLAIADIDFFKKVNDTYGHNAGDEVLKAVAGVMKKMMQGKGFAARWGGEEFILVFDKMTMEAAGYWLNHVLEEIRGMVVETEGYSIKITMTFGVVDGTDESSETMVEAADEKLYYGKQHGRNQVVTIVNEESSDEQE